MKKTPHRKYLSTIRKHRGFTKMHFYDFMVDHEPNKCFSEEMVKHLNSVKEYFGGDYKTFRESLYFAGVSESRARVLTLRAIKRKRRLLKEGHLNENYVGRLLR